MAISNIFSGIFVLICLSGSLVNAQNFQPSGAPLHHQHDGEVPCMTDEQEEAIIAHLKEQRAKLRAQGILKENVNRSSTIPLLTWPLRQAEGFSQFNYYTTNNFVDQDTTSPGILDYNCGSRTYNGHNGTDYNIFPFWWDMMEENQVEIIASAPGTIIAKHDNNFDQNCSCTGFWNAVYVEHADGSVAWYGHMKTGSLTSKPIGATVERGDYLGAVGSSGCSSNPHLHLEIRDADFNVIDPYEGTCNSTTSESLWMDQKPYREPGLLTLTTHDEDPVNGNFCPGIDNPHYENKFDAGATPRFVLTIRDQLDGDTMSLSLTYPNGDTLYAWNFILPGTYSSAWWYYTFALPTGPGTIGIWNWTAKFKGEVFSHPFIVGCPDDLVVDDVSVPARTQFVADNTISTTGPVQILSAQDGAYFMAGESITLNPDFEVPLGAPFEVLVGGCP